MRAAGASLSSVVVGQRDPKRTLVDWIALTIAGRLSFAIVRGLIYVTYLVEMTTFDDFHKCNKNRTLSRIEWVLDFRSAEDCGHF